MHHHPGSCTDVRAALQAYVDGDLSPEQAAALKRHLAGCSSCRAELARAQAVVTALKTWPLVPEPPQLTGRIMAQVSPRLDAPRFRLHWSDLVISLSGAALVFGAMLLWRGLLSTDQAYLCAARIALRAHVLRLEALRLLQRLSHAAVPGWGWLSLAGGACVLVLALGIWGRVPLPTQRRGR